MSGKLFLAFVLGMVVAGSAAWYLSSGFKPQAIAVTAAAPAPPEPPAPIPAVPEPSAPAPVPAPAPRRIAAARPAPAAPAPVQAPAVVQPVEAPKPVMEEAKPIDLPIPARQVDVGPPQAEELKPEPPKPRQPHTATIPAGTLITVRLNETLSSAHNEEGYNFHATLDAPLVVDGLVLAERGSPQVGRIVAVSKAARVKGHAKLVLELTELNTSDGQKTEIKTDPFERAGSKGEDKRQVAMRTGIGAAMGAAIGAMAGGGIGAAIGAGAGAGAGAGSVLVTKGEEIQLGSETRISFRLKEPITLTEKID